VTSLFVPPPGAEVPCFNLPVDRNSTPLTEVLERADVRLRSEDGDARLWPTGFKLLDATIGGGLRAGTLALVAGPQGQGKTTFALQVARNAVAAGRTAIFFSYELEAEVLLQKLVAMEAGERDPYEAPSLNQIRAVFEGTDGGRGGLHDRMAALPGGVEALLQVHRYAERLVTHRSTSSLTGIASIVEQVEDVIARHGEPPLVIVDYLQKVHDTKDVSEEEQTTRITEQLKDLSIEYDCPVLAIAAADRDGLEPGTRLRSRHLRGSTALAYEPDLVLIINTKWDVVARHHLMFDDGNTVERFRAWSVLTVEKNRSGKDGAELEFKKRFDQGRFEVEGNAVAERLVDERVFVD
jgi:replicative DNA helicase